MRGRLTAGTMLVALLTGLTLAGCAPELPAEVDTKLADDWAKVAEVKSYVPEVGICIVGKPQKSQYRAARHEEIDCSATHYGEVVHVGTFTGDTKPGPSQVDKAYAECDAKSAAYLGRPWYDARTQLFVATPSNAAWEGGARWFRCDVVEVVDASDDNTWLARTGSLKGAIPPATLVGCVSAKSSGDSITDMPEVACNKAHNSEWVGFFRAAAGTAYPKSDRQWDVLHRQCRALAAKFVGVSSSQSTRFGTIASPRNSEAWNAGDRAVRCAVWFDKKTMTKSARGTKGKGVPNF